MRSRPIRAGPCATPPMWPGRPRRPSRNCQCCGSCTRAPRALTATRREWEKRNELDMTDTRDVFLCDAVRTPIGRYGGALAKVRGAEIHDATLGWRFVNPVIKAQYGIDSMAETGENVAEEYQVSRADQDAFALRSQQRAGKAMAAGYFAEEIVPVEVAGKGGSVTVEKDEHPRPDTTLEGLGKLKPIVRDGGTITAGNASGINDGAAAVILASAEAVRGHGLPPPAAI